MALLAIDELGNVTDTRTRRDDDEAAPDQKTAVLEHISSAVKEADSRLERRRQEQPPKPEKTKPMDPATRRFLG